MQKLTLSFFFLILSATMAIAQGPNRFPPAVISFSFQQFDGTNGSAVAWDPTTNLYYATIAGNSEFPLEVFDSGGDPVVQREARADLRGLWWNKKTKTLQGNCAGDMGWVEIPRNSNGFPSGEPQFLFSGQRQPDFQSVGAYDAKKKQVVFYQEGSLYFYNIKTAEQKGTLRLQMPVSSENINFTTVGYTGKKKYEFVLLNFEANKLYFFNRKGLKTGEAQLPESAVTHPAFRFSFANGIAFLYDADMRKWTGYKVF